MMPRFQTDRGAIRFVLSGADIMCPGLTSAGAVMVEVDEDTPVVSGRGGGVGVGVGLHAQAASSLTAEGAPPGGGSRQFTQRERSTRWRWA